VLSCALRGAFFVAPNKKGGLFEMKTRIALVGIIIEDFESTAKVNAILHEYREFVVGRMGIPYAKRDVGVISIVLDAPGDAISALAGKLGMLPGVSSKTVYARKETE
jgi:putative iron-only hydrogenase system regulator